MPQKERRNPRRRVDVEVESNRTPILIPGGFAIPAGFAAKATVHDNRLGRITAELAVAVEDGRARVRTVTIGSDRTTGIGYDVLRAVPVREIVADAAASLLMQVEISTGGTPTISLVPVGENPGKTALEAIRRLVGWREGQ